MRVIGSGLIAERYEIRRLLGSGGMGQVYLAFDQLLRRQVALKLFALGGSAKAAEDFLREARLTARLSHPNIVTVHDVGTAEGHAFIAMEYVEGTSLEELCDTPQPWPDVLGMAREILKGLAYAHGRGVVHRDIKPSNLIRTEDGRVVILDLGISYAVETTTQSMAVSSNLMGTPAYMSPEQVRGEPIDGRTDLFSVGVVLYQLLTGQSPFQAPVLSETLAQVLHRIPPAPSAVQPLPNEVDRLVLRLLAKSPAKRYASAEEALEALERCDEGLLTIPVRPRSGGVGGRLSLLLSGGLVLVVVSSFLAVLLPGPAGRPEQEPTPAAIEPEAAGPPEERIALDPTRLVAPEPILAALPSLAPALGAVDPGPLPTRAPVEPTPEPRLVPTPVPLASLRVIIDRPARLLVDGKSYGETEDRELVLRPGRYKIVAISGDGRSAENVVTLDPEVPQIVRLSLRPPAPGRIEVRPPERMSLSVSADGVHVADCPCAPIELEAGTHTLRFVNQEAGYDRTLQVEVLSGQTVPVALEAP
jgi:serine/threonine-protein kinase